MPPLKIFILKNSGRINYEVGHRDNEKQQTAFQVREWRNSDRGESDYTEILLVFSRGRFLHDWLDPQ